MRVKRSEKLLVKFFFVFLRNEVQCKGNALITGVVEVVSVSKFSEEFGHAVVSLRQSLGLSRDSVSKKVQGRISPTYWGRMESGSIPSYDMIQVIHETFGEAARDVVAASGYSFPEPSSTMGNTAVPPTARLIGKGNPLPKGPLLSAGTANDTGDPSYETFSLDADARAAGADYLVTVKGDCLLPYIEDGDTVAVKIQSTGRNGQVVVVQVLSDFHGELGDAMTLKVYRPSGPHGRGFYRADGTILHSADEARIVGVVVKHYPRKAPTIK